MRDTDYLTTLKSTQLHLPYKVSKEQPAIGQWLEIRSIGPPVNTYIAVSELCTMYLVMISSLV